MLAVFLRKGEEVDYNNRGVSVFHCATKLITIFVKVIYTTYVL